jgi:hypothetical protein
MKHRLARLASSRWFIAVAVLLAIVLLLPTLRVGFMMDDYAQPMWLRGGPQPSGGPRGVWDMFRFQDADRVSLRLNMDDGNWPWWTTPELRLAFFRPLTSLTHAIDHRLFPGNAGIMRLWSIAIYGAAVAMAGLLYRRLHGATVAFGLATLMYALDDAHAVTTTWIANRNAVLAAVFGLGALWLHDRGVRDTDRRARAIAPIVFGVAMLAGEAALATLGYVVAHVLWLQTDSYKKRLATLAPYLGVAALWAAVYKLGGYGASGGGFYIDPGKEPLRFLDALVRRLPLLLEGQISFPPSEVWMLAFEHRTAAFVLAMSAALGLAAALAFGVRRTRENGFFATGMLLACVPICATWPSDRLLIFAGFGAFGLIGDLLTAPRDHLPYARRILVRAACGFFILLHLALAPVIYAGRGSESARMFHEPVERTEARLPPPSELAGKTVILVNAPDCLIFSFALLIRMERGDPRPARIRQLAVATEGRVTLRRTGEHRVSVTLTKGFFHDALSNVFRNDEQPLLLGDRVEIAGMTATVKEHTSDRKRAKTIEFELDAPVDGPGFVWLTWGEAGLERLGLPAVGEEIELVVIDYQRAMQGS